MKRFSRSAPLFLAPSIVVAGIVVGEYADTGAHWAVLIRPTLVAVIGTMFVQLSLLALRQSTARAAVITVALQFLLSGGRSGLLIVAVGGLVGVLWFVRHRHPPTVRPTTAFALSAAFFLVAVGRVVAGGAISVEDFASMPPVTASAPARSPSIYLLVLDAYARQDVLAKMGFDNEPFLTELEQRGFDVYRDSRSNYTWTASTLASMLNMRPLDETDGLPGPGSPDRAQTRSLRRAINSSAALALLRSEGYRTVSLPGLADYVRLYNADEVRDRGQLTEFEIHLLQDTTLAGIQGVIAPDFIGAQHRDRITSAFADFGPRRDSTFLMAHVMSPHQPFVFDAAGQPRAMPECFPRCWFWEPWGEFSAAEFADGYVAQVQYVNRETLRALDRVLTGDHDAVVIVMGDHGSRGVPSDPGEPFRNLMAVRSPGFPRLLGESPTPVNLFGAILGAYLDIDVPRWPDNQYGGRHLDAVQIAPIR